MSKITTDHLSRSAFVYVRQSTMGQVHHNLESQRRQYGLEQRARQLGWQSVVVIDEDLGRSGSGVARPGFDRLLAAVGRSEVGAVFAIEASRLARNGRDWHTLLEFCAIVGTLIIDEDGIYDPRQGTDQMVLGLKGHFSMMESSAIHQRSREAQREMAERGELFLIVASGYEISPAGGLVKTANLRVQAAIALVFQKFREFGSVRKVSLWLCKERIEMPVLSCGDGRWQVKWRVPTYSWLRELLSNPIYAGAYAYGRSAREMTLENGRRRIRIQRRQPREQWRVLLRDRHEGYIDWAEYERNQEVIADNANRSQPAARGAVRGGPALLTGRLRCGQCGQRLVVGYHKGKRGYYTCRRRDSLEPERCRLNIVFPRLDLPVGDALLRLLAPLGIEAALAAAAGLEERGQEQHRQAELALAHARYRADLARRQYDAVDPANRLVAGELERRWNAELTAVAQAEGQLAALAVATACRPTAAERERLLALGHDLPAAWNDPAAPVELRKRILRTVIREIVVRTEGERFILLIHWQGGDHTELEVARRLHGMWRDPELVESEPQTRLVIATLARMLPDSSIAMVLNRTSLRTASGLTWTRGRVHDVRNYHKIPCYRQGEMEERGELMLEGVMTELGVSKMTVIRMIKTGRLPAQQVCPGAPYLIRRADLDRPGFRHPPPTPPVSENPNQFSLEFQ